MQDGIRSPACAFWCNFSASCATRGKIVLLRRIKREDSGSRLNERPRPAAEKRTTPPDSVKPYSAYTTPTLACSACDMFSIPFAGSQTTALHSCCKRSLIPNSSSLVSPLITTDWSPSSLHRRIAASAAFASLVSSQRVNITSLANWINASQRCCWLSAVSRSLA